jgi:hypothetical protein
MTSRNLKVLWENNALLMLEKRDRYTRSDVLTEFIKTISSGFNEAATQKSVLFDPVRKGYVTPVLDGRFAVVWYDCPEINSAIVSAFFPASGSFSNVKQADLKDWVQRAAKRESDGRVLLP